MEDNVSNFFNNLQNNDNDEQAFTKNEADKMVSLCHTHALLNKSLLKCISASVTKFLTN
jgi:hypothetical protein